MPDLAGVDGACGSQVVWGGDDLVEVWAEGHWELFRWDPVPSCV